MSRLLYVQTIFILTCCCFSLKADNVLILSRDTSYLNIKNYIYLFEDSENKYSIEEIADTANHFSFRPLSEYPDLLGRHRSYWMKITVENRSKVDDWVFIAGEVNNILSYYYRENNKWFVFKSTILHSSKTFDEYLSLQRIDFNNLSNQTTTYYFKLQDLPIFNGIKIKPQFITLKKWQDLYSRMILFLGLCFGLFFILLMINGLIYTRFKNPASIYYCLCILGYVVNIMFFEKIYFPVWINNLNIRLFFLSFSIAWGIFYNRFLFHLFELKNGDKKIRNFFTVMFYLSLTDYLVCCCFTYLVHVHQYDAFLFTGLLIFVLGFIQAAVIYNKKKDNISLLIFIGAAILVASMITAQALIIFANVLNTYFIVIFSFLIESTLYCFALVQWLYSHEVSRVVTVEGEKIIIEKEKEKIEAIDIAKNNFIANITHEFRTPLTLITGSAEQMEEYLQKSALKHPLNVIKKSSSLLLKLVNELLDLSRLESDKFKLSGWVDDVAYAIKLIWQNYISEAERKKITYILDVEGDSIHMWFDRNVLEKILHNLLSNALKYTGPFGEIKTTVRVINNKKGRDPFLEITVKDTGIGIAEEHLPRIFERFYQADAASIRKGQGTGIGLSLVNDLVKLHKGMINVQSKPGFGTTFTVRLPMRESIFSGEMMQENVKEISSSGVPDADAYKANNEYYEHPDPEMEMGNPKILIVEDNNDLRAYLKNILRGSYKVYTAENGREGLQKALEKLPELVLSDVMMPVMDGNELCKALKSNILTSHIPVILLTARADTKSRITGLELGADDYIVKPFLKEEIMVRIKNLIRQRRMLRDKFSENFGPEIKKLAGNTRDVILISRITEHIAGSEDKSRITVEGLCEMVGMSESNLFRKIKAITNYTPSEFIRFIKIRCAITLMKEGKTVSEAAYESGFNSLSYFSKCFKSVTGHLPSEHFQ